MLTAAELIGLFDRLGIVVVAFGGVQVGLSRRLDLFGLVVMGVVSATGGGLLRDVVLGRLPLVLDRPDYLLLAVGASLIAIPAGRLKWRGLRVALAAADAGGVGAFAVAGALAAIERDLALPAVVLLAILTAVGGGVLRDLLADRVPLVLLSEVRASAAGLGGLAVWAAHPLSAGGSALIGLAVASGIAGAGFVLRLRLPAPGGRRSGEIAEPTTAADSDRPLSR